MIERTLKPIRERNKYWELIHQQLEYDLFTQIYEPLLQILEGEDEPDVRRAARSPSSDLIKAFEDKRIRYEDGFVFGSFNATISKALRDLGGRFNKTRKGYRIDMSRFPVEVRAAIARAVNVEKERIERVRKKLGDLPPEMAPSVRMGELSKYTMADLDRQFKEVTPQDLEIPMTFHEATEERIRKEYTDNIDLAIRGYSSEAVAELRRKLEGEIGKGIRAEQLKELIRKEFGVSTRRARFIAKQETGILLSKYRQTRYEDAGIDLYRWSTSGDHRVRDDHADLDGRVFRFDDPPIVDKRTGRRGNPGEDFGCRCVSLPILKTYEKIGAAT